MKTAQHFDRNGDGVRGKNSGAKDRFAQARDFAVFRNFDQVVAQRREIFRRTEFEPISTAASVGMTGA